MKQLKDCLEAVKNSEKEYKTTEGLGIDVLREYFTVYNEKAPEILRKDFNELLNLNFSNEDIKLVSTVTEKEINIDLELNNNKEYSLQELNNINEAEIKKMADFLNKYNLNTSDEISTFKEILGRDNKNDNSALEQIRKEMNSSQVKEEAAQVNVRRNK